MTQILDLTDKLVRFPIAYNLQPVRGFPIKHFDTILTQNSQRTKQNALGEGPWDACEKLWVDAFEIPDTDFIFHPGLGSDAPDANFPFDAPHPWTAYISAKCKAGLSEDQTDKLFGIYRTLRTGNYNGSGQQLNSVGTIVTPSDPRDEYFFKPNPANVSVDQIIRWGKRLNSIVNWPAWVNWRDYNDELIPWDDAAYTPRSLSLTPTSGGSLTPGTTYYIRVSTMKSSDESSGSLKTIETKANSITLIGGQTAFQVNWLIKGDEQNPVANPSGITAYRVYIGTVSGTWLGYFTVSNPAARSLLITTTSGVTAGSPLDIATSGLLRQIKRFECGLFFIPPYDLSTALDRICQISCADWQWSSLGTSTYRNDKVMFMSPADRTPVFTLNLAETGMGSFKTYPVDRRNRPNQIIVNFRDRDDEFLGEAQPVILDREQLQIDDKQTKAFTIEGGTMYRSQAQRVASFYARVLCDMDQMAEMVASPKSYHMLPGDPFLVTNDVPDWEDVKFIARKKGENVERGIGDTVLGQLYTDGLYSDTDYSPLPRPLPVPRLDPFEAPPVATNLVLTEVNIISPDFSFNTGFQGTFDFGAFHGPQIARVLVKGPAVSEPPDAAYNELQILIPDANNQGSFQFRGLAGGHYWVKIQTESSLGSSLPSGQLTGDIQLTIPIPTILKVFDTIPKRDFNDGLGIHVGVARDISAGEWIGCQIWKDRGYGYERIAQLNRESFLGHSTDNGDIWLAPTAGKIYFQVEGGLTFAPSNATLLEIAAGKNNLFIGREKIGVQTWTSLGGGLWKGENLVRGMSDTDHLQATHTLQEDIIVIDETVVFLPMEPRDIDMTINFKAVTFGLLITAVTAVSCDYKGNSIIPHPPIEFTGSYDNANGSLRVDWEPVASQAADSNEYELEIRNAAGSGASTIRGPMPVKPLNSTRISTTPPLQAVQPSGVYLPLTAYTYIEPGGFDVVYTKAQWNATFPSLPPQASVLVAGDSLSIFGGAFLEMQVPEGFDPLTNSLVPQFFGFSDIPSNEANAAWFFTREFTEIGLPVIAKPASAPLEYEYTVAPGDRLSVHIQPDGTIIFYINYIGAMSDPWYVSAHRQDMTALYKASFENVPDYEIAGSTITIGARNVRLLLNTPEFMYTGAMQKEDNLGSLPGTVHSRVKMKSLYLYGKPSDWTYGSFVRP